MAASGTTKTALVSPSAEKAILMPSSVQVVEEELAVTAGPTV